MITTRAGKRHHRLKHHGTWQIARPKHGELRWTSPTGASATITTGSDEPPPL